MRTKGFTLVEIMIVVGVIMVLAVIAVPNFIRSRLIANEAGAIAACRVLTNALILYQNNEGAYPDKLLYLISPSSNPPYIDSLLAGAITPESAKTGYYYVYSDVDNVNSTFKLQAIPKNLQTGSRHFYTDQNGIIHYAVGRDATVNDPTVD